MDGKQRERSLNWGSIRSESQWDDNGAVTLHSAETQDLDALAAAVREFVESTVEGFDFSESELQQAFGESDWLLGYVAGASQSCLKDAGNPSDTSLSGFASRVCGELMGGGIRNKVTAYEYLTRRADSDDFRRGRADGRHAWADEMRH